MLKKPCFQLLFLDKMLAYLVQSCVTRSYSWFGCYFLCFDLLLLTLSITKKIKRKVRFNCVRHCFTLIFILYISPSIKRWIILCSIKQDSIKHISSARHQFSLPNVIVSLSLSNHAPFNLLETRQKRLRHVNVIFSPRVVKTPVQDQKFGTNSLDKTVYEIMQIEVHVRASWLSSEVRDCLRYYYRLQSRKR